MANVIDNIAANYIWYLVGFITITMVIIGYFADKTDFGHKKNTIVKKVENSPDEVDVSKLKDKKLSDAISGNINSPVIPDLGVPEDLNAPFGDNGNISSPESTSIANEDLNVPFGDKTDSASSINTPNFTEDLNAPLNDIPVVNEDLAAPLDTTPIINEDLNAPINTVVNEDLNAPISASVSPIGEDINNNLETPLVSADSNDVAVVSESTPINEIKADNMQSLNSDDADMYPEELKPINITENIDIDMPYDTQEASNDVTDSKNSMPIVDTPNNISSLVDTEDGTIDQPVTQYQKDDDYDTPIVPEVIMDKLDKDDIKSDDDIWKF